MQTADEDMDTAVKKRSHLISVLATQLVYFSKSGLGAVNSKEENNWWLTLFIGL